MWRLYQFPLCPFSRKVRLLMSEKGIGYELWRENPWDNRDEFWALNPAGRTPVLHDPDKKLTLCDSRAICEYFEETVDQTPLIGGTARERAEIRRLVALFDESFFNGLKDMLESTTDKVALLAFRTYCKREMDRTQVLALADGSIFTGRQALKNGLVDALGGEAEIRAYLKSRDIDDTLDFVDWKPADETANLLLGTRLASIVQQFLGLPVSLSSEIDRLSGGKLFLDGLVSVWQVGGQSESFELGRGK